MKRPEKVMTQYIAFSHGARTRQSHARTAERQRVESTIVDAAARVSRRTEVSGTAGNQIRRAHLFSQCRGGCLDRIGGQLCLPARREPVTPVARNLERFGGETQSRRVPPHTPFGDGQFEAGQRTTTAVSRRISCSFERRHQVTIKPSLSKKLSAILGE
jgi:hypothetical protein